MVCYSLHKQEENTRTPETSPFKSVSVRNDGKHQIHKSCGCSHPPGTMRLLVTEKQSVSHTQITVSWWPLVTPHKKPSEVFLQTLRNLTERACPQPDSKQAQHILKNAVHNLLHPILLQIQMQPCTHIWPCMCDSCHLSSFCPGMQSSAPWCAGLGTHGGFMGK